MVPYQFQYQQDGAYMYAYTIETDVDREDPVTITLSYHAGAIPSDNEQNLADIKNYYRTRTNNARTNSMYTVRSETHEVLQEKNVSVTVDRGTDTASARGCVSLNIDELIGQARVSVRFANGSSKDWTESDDNFLLDCFDNATKFPLIVSFSYRDENGEACSGQVRLQTPLDYTINCYN